MHTLHGTRRLTLLTRSSELLRGTLDLLILHALSSGVSSSRGIADWLYVQSGAVLEISSGSLCPALHRLERRGLIASRWQQSEQLRRAKTYSLTQAGRANIAREIPNWTLFVAAASVVFGVDPLASRRSAGAHHNGALPHAAMMLRTPASPRRTRVRR